MVTVVIAIKRWQAGGRVTGAWGHFKGDCWQNSWLGAGDEESDLGMDRAGLGSATRTQARAAGEAEMSRSWRFSAAQAESQNGTAAAGVQQES